MSLKGKMTVLGFTQGIELKNCSNNIWCDSASDYNGKNSKEFAPSEGQSINQSIKLYFVMVIPSGNKRNK